MRLLMLTGAGLAGAAAAAALAFAAQAHPGHDGAAGPTMMLHHGLADMDKNGDGAITRDEFLAHPAAMFDRLDANHDGKVTKDELAAMHQHMIQVCKTQGPGDAQAKDVPCPPMGPGGPGGPGMHMMLMHHLESLDANHDGRVSFEELQEPLRKHFLALDKNNNGFIDKDELPGASGDVVIEQRVDKND